MRLLQNRRSELTFDGRLFPQVFRQLRQDLLEAVLHFLVDHLFDHRVVLHIGLSLQSVFGVLLAEAEDDAVAAVEKRPVGILKARRMQISLFGLRAGSAAVEENQIVQLVRRVVQVVCRLVRRFQSRGELFRVAFESFIRRGVVRGISSRVGAAVELRIGVLSHVAQTGALTRRSGVEHRESFAGLSVNHFHDTPLEVGHLVSALRKQSGFGVGRHLLRVDGADADFLQVLALVEASLVRADAQFGFAYRLSSSEVVDGARLFLVLGPVCDERLGPLLDLDEADVPEPHLTAPRERRVDSPPSSADVTRAEARAVYVGRRVLELLVARLFAGLALALLRTETLAPVSTLHVRTPVVVVFLAVFERDFSAVLALRLGVEIPHLLSPDRGVRQSERSVEVCGLGLHRAAAEKASVEFFAEVPFDDAVDGLPEQLL